MQTDFTAKQLRDPRLVEVQDILHRCTHCGLCNATCPTYVLTGDERESPRGRIYLIKSMLERGKAPRVSEIRHIDSCLNCLSCVTTCPYAVDYKHLIDFARIHVESKGTRGPKERLTREAFLKIMPEPSLLRQLLRYARFVRPMSRLLKRIGLPEIAAMLDMAPSGLLPSATFAGPGLAATKVERRYRVALLTGCTQQVMRPEINDATIRLLARRGVDVVVAPDTGCCGSYARALGRETTAIEQATANVDAWMKLISKDDLDAIIINGAACGTTVKDYPQFLQQVPDYEWKAQQIAGMTRDVTEFLDGFDLGPPKRWSSLRVAYHSSCLMRHGQAIDKAPRELLSNAGFAVVDIPEGHLCCGAASGYNMLHSQTADELRDRKVSNIERAKVDLVACGDVSCMSQLGAAMNMPVVHTVELLDWAYGGPVPRGLEKLTELVSDVPDSLPERSKARGLRLPLGRLGRASQPTGDEEGVIAAKTGETV